MPTPISDRAATASISSLKESIRSLASDSGFDIIRFTLPGAIPSAGDKLMTFLEQGRHGDMVWMEETAERRRDPAALWDDARSVVVLGLNYGPDANPMEALDETSNGVISVYARGKDYHGLIKKKLKQVAGWLHRETGSEVKVFVDTAPVMEKPLAQASGAGWQGKHTNLVSREFGSWLFLGSIFTTLELPPDDAETDHCGACRACLDVCPTRAFPAAYQLDARRCISYLTIEHKGHIGLEFRQAMGNRIFGCDDCLAVCPWNKFAQVSRETRLAARAETDNPPLADLLVLDDAAFRERFAGTPVKRTGRDRFMRNVLIAAGNSGDNSLVGPVQHLLKDASPLVRAMAVWACGRLMNEGDYARLREVSMAGETDASVRKEWDRGAP